jgi:hypothetical protein
MSRAVATSDIAQPHSYTWDAPSGASRSVDTYSEVSLCEATDILFTHIKLGPEYDGKLCINPFMLPLHYNTGPYSPFPPTNNFTPCYPMYLRPESPLVPTPHIPHSGSFDHIPGRTDAELMEAKFAAHLFDDILPGTIGKGRRTRLVFRWPIDVTVKDQLLVVLRCMKNAGFGTIGKLLAAMFSKELRDSKSTKHLIVSHSIAAFLHCQSIDPQTFPVAIVDAIYRHPSSQTFNRRIPPPPHFNLPQYARPPSERVFTKSCNLTFLAQESVQPLARIDFRS